MFKRTNKYINYREKTLKLIGEDCRQARIKCGYSQKYVARAIGVHQTQISQFENGVYDSAVTLFYYQEFIFPIANSK